jgi:RNA polymerase sigma-70 factor (ECF subfamily)
VTVNTQTELAERFEEQRPRLRAVANRMLGSVSDAEDAVQETWLRLSRVDSAEIENLAGWLTTVVARVSLNVLRQRRTRPQEPLEFRLPDLIIDPADGTDPEHEALLADAVGLALLVVLDTLTPQERVAFVLHDMFSVPFGDIAELVGRSPEAARQLASRARRRVRGGTMDADADLSAQWQLVDAWLAAARAGDFAALIEVLDPDVVLRTDGGATGRTREARGAETVARQAIAFRGEGLTIHRALVNGTAGAVATRDGKPFSVGAFAIRNGKIAEVYFLVDPERLARLDLKVLAAEAFSRPRRPAGS